MRVIFLLLLLFYADAISAHVHDWVAVKNDDSKGGGCTLVCNFTGQLHVIHLAAGDCPPHLDVSVNAAVIPHQPKEDQPVPLVEEQPQEDTSVVDQSL